MVTFYAFCVSVVVGAIMAICMVLYRKGWDKHYGQFLMIATEWLTIKNPKELSRIAAERKPTMMLPALRHSHLHRINRLLFLCGHDLNQRTGKLRGGSSQGCESEDSRGGLRSLRGISGSSGAGRHDPNDHFNTSNRYRLKTLTRRCR